MDNIIRYFIYSILIICICACEKASSIEPFPEENYNVNSLYRDSILFTSYRNVGTTFSPSIYIMNKDGSGIRALANQWFTSQATWSSDKSQILFIADESWGAPERVLYMMDSNGQNKIQLLSKEEGAWIARISPDGSKIGFICTNDSKRTIKILDLFDNSIKPIKEIYTAYLSWTSDSKSIVCTFDKELYLINDDSSYEILYESENGHGIYGGDVSPDGKSIIFHGITTNLFNFGVYEFYFANKTVRLLHEFQSQNVFHSSYSKDGNYIVMSVQDRGDIPIWIYIMDADGYNLQRITDHPEGDVMPDM